MVDEGVGGGGGRGKTAGGDDGGAAFADGFAERALEPRAVRDDGGGGLAVDGGVGEGWEHRGAVVAVDEDVFDGGEIDAGLFGELGLRAVLVEAHHRGETIGGQALGLGGGDHAIGVGGIADHGDAGISGGDGVDDFTLLDENLTVVLEQIGALHAGAAGLGADEKAPIGVFETDGSVGGLHDAFEQRERAVIELHGDAFEGFEGFLDRGFDELEDDGLVGTEHRAGGDAEKQRVTDLTGSSGDGDANGGFHKSGDHCETAAERTKDFRRSGRC